MRLRRTSATGPCGGNRSRSARSGAARSCVAALLRLAPQRKLVARHGLSPRRRPLATPVPHPSAARRRAPQPSRTLPVPRARSAQHCQLAPGAEAAKGLARGRLDAAGIARTRCVDGRHGAAQPQPHRRHRRMRLLQSQALPARSAEPTAHTARSENELPAHTLTWHISSKHLSQIWPPRHVWYFLELGAHTWHAA